MSAAKKTSARKKPAAKKAPAKRAAAPAKRKAVAKTKAALKPKPKGTHPSKKDVGIFGAIQKNIQDGLSVITETILPSPKKKSRR